MYFIYVLQSKITNNLYIGYTENIKKRLAYHNSGKVLSTKPHRPYQLIYSEEHDSKQSALRREKQIKRSGKVRKLLKEGKYKGPIV